LPVGAYGGRKEIMEHIAPAGNVYQAGTLSGNPLAMTAGIATLEILQQPVIWEKMEGAVSKLAQGVAQIALENGIPIKQTAVGTMFSTFFTEQEIKDWPSVKTCDTNRFGKYFQKMLEAGIYLAPSQFEAGFMSTAHNEDIIDKTIDAVGIAFQSLT